MFDSKILEATYFDRFSLFRKEKIKNPTNGVTETKEVEIYSNEKCALSQNRRTDLLSVEGVGSVSESFTFFCNPSFKLNLGDRLVITSLNGENTFKIASMPFKYHSHQELFVSQKDRI